MKPKTLFDVRPGDTVCRFLGDVPMPLVVSEITADRIYCGPRGKGYSFDKVTGAEVDEEIGWGPAFGKTGSYIVAVE